MGYQAIKRCRGTLTHTAKKSVWRDYLLYDSNYMTIWRGKTLEIVKSLAVAKREEWIGGD